MFESHLAQKTFRVCEGWNSRDKWVGFRGNRGPIHLACVVSISCLNSNALFIQRRDTHRVQERSKRLERGCMISVSLVRHWRTVIIGYCDIVTFPKDNFSTGALLPSDYLLVCLLDIATILPSSRGSHNISDKDCMAITHSLGCER